MAYMDQEKKAKIAAALKEVMPKRWRYTLSVQHNSILTLIIVSTPIDLFAQITTPLGKPTKYYAINAYSLDRQFKGELLEIFEKIKAAMNLNNYDNSNARTGYFDVGHYVRMEIGKHDRPFKIID